MKKLIPFNVINYDANRRVFEAYDVMPYFLNEYKRLKKSKRLQKIYPLPTTFDDFKEFISREGHYQFWARCEYEIILVDWPCQKIEEKWDVWRQIEMNLDTVTNILMKNLGIC